MLTGEHRRGGPQHDRLPAVRHKRDTHDKIGSRALVILSCSSHSIDQSCELTVSRPNTPLRKSVPAVLRLQRLISGSTIINGSKGFLSCPPK